MNMKATMYRTGVEKGWGENLQSQEVTENRVLLVACWIRRVLILAAFAALCSGCAVAAMSSRKNFSVSEEVKLDGSTQNVMAVAEEVGKSLGYRVNSRMKNGDFTSLGFERDSSMIVTMATGYARMAHIMVMHNPKEEKLHLTMIVAGNLGAGSEADAQKTLQAFRDKLQERLGVQK
jgi:hypothetical protein